MKIKIDPYYVYLMVQGGGYSEEVRKKVESSPLVQKALKKRREEFGENKS